MSAMDGWNYDDMPQVKGVLEEIANLTYELENCQKGAYTRCYTYEELRDYIERLGGELQDAAGELDGMEDPDEEEDEEGYEDPDFQDEEDDTPLNEANNWWDKEVVRRPGESPEHFELRKEITSAKREESRAGWAQIRAKYQNLRDYYGEMQKDARKKMAIGMKKLKDLEAYEKEHPYQEPEEKGPEMIPGRDLETLHQKVREVMRKGCSRADVEKVFKEYAPYMEKTQHDKDLLYKCEYEDRLDETDEWPFDELESLEGAKDMWNAWISAYHRSEARAGIL